MLKEVGGGKDLMISDISTSHLSPEDKEMTLDSVLTEKDWEEINNYIFNQASTGNEYLPLAATAKLLSRGHFLRHIKPKIPSIILDRDIQRAKKWLSQDTSLPFSEEITNIACIDQIEPEAIDKQQLAEIWELVLTDLRLSEENDDVDIFIGNLLNTQQLFPRQLQELDILIYFNKLWGEDLWDEYLEEQLEECWSSAHHHEQSSVIRGISLRNYCVFYSQARRLMPHRLVELERLHTTLNKDKQILINSLLSLKKAKHYQALIGDLLAAKITLAKSVRITEEGLVIEPEKDFPQVLTAPPIPERRRYKC